MSGDIALTRAHNDALLSDYVRRLLFVNGETLNRGPCSLSFLTA